MRETGERFVKKLGICGMECDFSRRTQTSLKGMFVSSAQKSESVHYDRAKRPEKSAFFVPRAALDSLRWHGVDQTFLQPTESAASFATAGADSRARGQLSSQRLDSGSALFADRRLEPHQSNSNPPVQRNISFAVGASTISRPIDAASLFATLADSLGPQAGAVARPLASGTVCPASGTDHSYLRLGFGGADSLRTATRRSEEHTSELQSLRHIVCRLMLEKKNKTST